MCSFQAFLYLVSICSFQASLNLLSICSFQALAHLSSRRLCRLSAGRVSRRARAEQLLSTAYPSLCIRPSLCVCPARAEHLPKMDTMGSIDGFVKFRPPPGPAGPRLHPSSKAETTVKKKSRPAPHRPAPPLLSVHQRGGRGTRRQRGPARGGGGESGGEWGAGQWHGERQGGFSQHLQPGLERAPPRRGHVPRPARDSRGPRLEPPGNPPHTHTLIHAPIPTSRPLAGVPLATCWRSIRLLPRSPPSPLPAFCLPLPTFCPHLLSSHLAPFCLAPLLSLSRSPLLQDAPFFTRPVAPPPAPPGPIAPSSRRARRAGSRLGLLLSARNL